MFSPQLTKKIAHRQTSVTGTDDDRIDLFLHGIPLRKRGFRRAFFERDVLNALDCDDRFLAHGSILSF
jgi:hypothetical protein